MEKPETFIPCRGFLLMEEKLETNPERKQALADLRKFLSVLDRTEMPYGTATPTVEPRPWDEVNKENAEQAIFTYFSKDSYGN